MTIDIDEIVREAVEYAHEVEDGSGEMTLDNAARHAAEAARDAEGERCAKLIHDALSPDCLAEDHEFCDAYGCGRFKAIIAALREGREPTKSGGRE